MLPLSLYIHFPWCVKKCPYCDFNSHETLSVPQEEYAQALLHDLSFEVHKAQGRELQSVFIGGGTPSLFEARFVQKVLSEVEASIGFSSNIEVTLEVNPGTSEYSNLSAYRDAGVNRLSFGVQSFDNRHLKKLGRIHCNTEVVNAFSDARMAGFDNINLDLMYGLSGQTPQQALDDLRVAFDLGPEHLSWYQLTLEPNTVFYTQRPDLPNDDELADIQALGLEALRSQGYEQYEVSAYAREGKRSLHNLNYWRFGDYLAIGAGAHGKVSSLSRKEASQGVNTLDIERYRKSRKPGDYLSCEGDKTLGRTKVAESEQVLEFMMNALRLVEGVPSRYLLERTNVSESLLNKLGATMRDLESKGLIDHWPQRIQCSKLGFQFLNSVLGFFED